MKFATCILLFAISAAGFAQAAVVGVTDDPTVIGGGARPLGMGRAFTAVVDDADAPFINPAGIASLKGPQGMAMFTNLLGEIYYAEYCGAIPAPFGTVGAGYITTGTNNIPTVVNNTTVPSDYYDSLLLFSYSTPLARFFGYGKNIFAGGSYKIYNRGFTGGVNQTATGLSVDLGMKFIVSEHFSFGFNRQNILPVSMGGVVRYSTGVEETLASLTKIGVAVRPPRWKGDILIAFDADLPASSARPITLHLGSEWKMNRNLTLRGGLDQSVDTGTASSTSTNPTFGLSLSFAGFRVDYAYHTYYNDPAAATTYLSLSISGEPWLALKGGPTSLPEGRLRRGR